MMDIIQRQVDEFFKKNFDKFVEDKEFVDKVRTELYKYKKKPSKIEFITGILEKVTDYIETHQKECTAPDDCPINRTAENIKFFLNEELGEYEEPIKDIFNNRNNLNAKDFSSELKNTFTEILTGIGNVKTKIITEPESMERIKGKNEVVLEAEGMQSIVKLKADYFQRYIIIIKSSLEDVKEKEIIHCRLVGIIADDINPDFATSQLGFCILCLKCKPKEDAKITLNKQDFVIYNESVLDYCYEQLALIGSVSKEQEYLRGNILEEIKSVIDNKVEGKDIKHEESKTSITDEGTNRELENAHVIIKHLGRTIKTLKQGLTENELFNILQETRKKNGNPNYSAIGKIIGCTNHTAKAKCKYFNLK